MHVHNIIPCISNSEQSRAGEELLHQLLSDNTWYKFAQLLVDNDQTHKFVQLITALGNQKMKFMNMSWKSALDMGSLYMCSTTSNMVYNHKWLEFCPVSVSHVRQWCHEIHYAEECISITSHLKRSKKAYSNLLKVNSISLFHLFQL